MKLFPQRLEDVDEQIMLNLNIGNLKKADSLNLYMFYKSKKHNLFFYKQKAIINYHLIMLELRYDSSNYDIIKQFIDQNISYKNPDLQFYYHVLCGKYYSYINRNGLSYKEYTKAIILSKNSTFYRIQGERILLSILCFSDLGIKNKKLKEESEKNKNFFLKNIKNFSTDIIGSFYYFNIYESDLKNEKIELITKKINKLYNYSLKNQDNNKLLISLLLKARIDPKNDLNYLKKSFNIRNNTESFFFRNLPINSLINFYSSKNNIDSTKLYFNFLDNELKKSNNLFYLFNKIYRLVNKNKYNIESNDLEKIYKIEHNDFKNNIFNNYVIEFEKHKEESRKKSLFIFLGLSIIILLILTFNLSLFKKNKQNAEITRLNEILIKKNKRLQDYTYILSHDLKTPFATIQNLTSLINNKGFKSMDLSQIKNISSESLHKINTILNYYKYTNENTINIKLKEIKVRKFIDEVYELYYKKHYDLLFINKINENTVILADKYLLNEVFINLFNNSIKYKKKEQSRCHIEVLDIQIDNSIDIIFKDYGQGIYMENLEKIFEIGFKESNSEDNFGVGLKFVKKIFIDVFKGKIWAASDKNKFTEIHLMFLKNN